jgi:hypothetical protein
MRELRAEAQRSAARAEATEADVLHYSLAVRAAQAAAQLEATEAQRLNDLTAAWYTWRAAVDDFELDRIKAWKANLGPNGRPPTPLALGYSGGSGGALAFGYSGGSGGALALGGGESEEHEYGDDFGDDRGRMTPMERYQTPTWLDEGEAVDDEDGAEDEDAGGEGGGEYDGQGNYRGQYGAVAGDYDAAMLGTRYGDVGDGLEPPRFLARSTTPLPL